MPNVLTIDEYVARLVASAPPLSPEQLERLAVILHPRPATRGDVQDDRRRAS